MFSTIVFFHYLIGNIFLTTFETKCSNKMLSTKCYVKTWYGFKYTLKLYSIWKIYAFKMKFYLSLLYITTYMSFIKEFIYILLMHIMFLYYQALQYIVCPSGWVSRKLYQEKNKLASGSRNYFVWISLLFYSWQNYWKYQFLPLFVDKSFFIKMNCQKYGRSLAQIEDKSKNKWLRKKYSNIKTGNFI